MASSSQGEKRLGPLSTEPKAKAKTQAKAKAKAEEKAEAKTQAASSSGDPQPKPAEKASSSSGDEDIGLHQQAPRIAPSRANMQILREQLAMAYQHGKITDPNDKDLYTTNKKVKDVAKSAPKVKATIRSRFIMLYSTYVYNPAKEERRTAKIHNTTCVEKKANK